MKHVTEPLSNVLANMYRQMRPEDRDRLRKILEGLKDAPYVDHSGSIARETKKAKKQIFIQHMNEPELWWSSNGQPLMKVEEE